jgi:hypothetical protein
MGKLDINRMSDSTKLSRVDNAHVALEADLEEILGIPDNTPITNPIFGVSPDSQPPVGSDGAIRAIMQFYESGVVGDPNDASGFEWVDGTETKRLIMINSGLKIYRLQGQTWSPVTDLENTVQGSGYLANLSDVDPSLAPTAGQLLAWDNGNSWWEAVDPASASGKTRFADLDDTPDPSATGDPFNASDVGSIVCIASTTSLGFKPEPAGLGDPFVMMLTAEASEEDGWGTSIKDAWTDVYNWGFQTFADDGGFLTDDTSLLTNDTVPDVTEADKFITLTAGLYNISLYYEASNPTKWGTRQWIIVGSNSDGPATNGIQQEANLFWQPTGIPDDEQPVALPGNHFLGSAALVQFADGTIKFQVKQDSGFRLNDVVFYATIQKVK